jgi:hypothetical protein
MAHAITLSILGIVISTLGLIAIIMQDLAPAWYGWALIVFSLPVTWMGGKLAIIRRIEQMESDHVVCHTGDTGLDDNRMDGIPPGPEKL